MIAFNMRAASACVTEVIARALPFRRAPSTHYARTRLMLAECVKEHEAEDAFVASASPHLARGNEQPLPGLPVLLEGEIE